MSNCMRYQQQISQMLAGRAGADTARTSAHLP